MLVAYGVVPSDIAAPGEIRPGLELLGEGDVGVVFEEVREPPGRDTEELVRFGRVIRRLGADAAILPMRYGTVLASIDELRRLLAERREGWERRLRELSGRVELVVHLTPADLPEAPPAGGATGTDYLMGRVHRARRVASLAEGLSSGLAPVARGVRLLPDRREVRVAVLIEQGEVDAALAAVEAWASVADAGQVTVSGPWPPFSFAEEES